MKEELSKIKELLFDAPADIKKSFNSIAEYLAREENRTGINVSKREKLSSSSKSLGDISFKEMLSDMGFDVDSLEYKLPEVKVHKSSYNGYTSYDFTLKDTWRVFQIYVFHQRVLVTLYYHSDNLKTKLIDKVISQEERNGELSMIAKSFSDSNLYHMLDWILKDSK